MLTSPEKKLSLIAGAVKSTVPAPEIGMRVGMAGKYKAEIRRNGVLVRETDWFSNLILNQGKDRLGQMSLANSMTSFAAYGQVGSGTSAASATQTQLDTYVGAQAFAVSSPPLTNSGSPNWIASVTYTYPFAQGALIGNISEVGVGWTSTNGNLFSRARIVDGSSNPITLTLTSLDQMTLYYTLSFIPDLTTTSGTVVLDGITYSYNAYCSSIGSLSTNPFSGFSRDYPFFTLGDAISVYMWGTGTSLPGNILTAGMPTGSAPNWDQTSKGSGSTRNITYVNGNYYHTTTFTVPPARGNVTGGIKFMQLWNYCGYQAVFYTVLEFSPPIPKDNTRELSLTYTVNWG